MLKIITAVVGLILLIYKYQNLQAVYAGKTEQTQALLNSKRKMVKFMR